jgi:DNA-binding NtrC family response regulator
MDKLNVLIVDDEDIIRNEISDFFERKNIYRIFTAENPSKCYSVLHEHLVDIIILDINMPEENGIDVLKKIKAAYPDIEVIMITGQGDNKMVDLAASLGALDFFYKPIGLTDIQQTIERTKRYIKIKEKLARANKNFNVVSEILKSSEVNIIGCSSQIKNVIGLALKAASSKDTSVLISGPSGSGKELIAKVLHYKSGRKDDVFYPVNCSAIPDNLIESEFFGYKKGSFTGANEDRMGYFEMANNGTLFLDEIGDLSLNAQSKILRALEDRRIKRIGDGRDIEIDLRIISATNKNLNIMVKEKSFREDLLYRLNTIEIKVPPLKERREDIPLLIRYYVEYYSAKIRKKPVALSQEAMDILTEYKFPGNIRELKNIIERAVILCDKDIIDINNISIPEEMAAMAKSGYEPNDDDDLPTLELQELEQLAIKQALHKCRYNQKNAAKLLNISVFALSRKITKYLILTK